MQHQPSSLIPHHGNKRPHFPTPRPHNVRHMISPASHPSLQAVCSTMTISQSTIFTINPQYNQPTALRYPPICHPSLQVDPPFNPHMQHTFVYYLRRCRSDLGVIISVGRYDSRSAIRLNFHLPTNTTSFPSGSPVSLSTKQPHIHPH